MIYEYNKNVYVYANNKYYMLELKNDNLVPTKKVEYELPKGKKITSAEAIKILKGYNSQNNSQHIGSKKSRGIIY